MSAIRKMRHEAMSAYSAGVAHARRIEWMDMAREAKRQGDAAAVCRRVRAARNRNHELVDSLQRMRRYGLLEAQT